MIDEYPDIEFDLWDLFHVDLREVFLGNRSPRWAYGFVERCFVHPFSVTRAKLRANPPIVDPTSKTVAAPSWRDWYGWDWVAIKVAENSDLFTAANTDPKSRPHQVWRPSAGQSQPKTLEDAYRQLMNLNR